MKRKFIILGDFIKKNPLLCMLFFLTTLFFLFQHYFDLSWDFSAYMINAKYMFYGGDYFEVYRAPMISFILGILMIFDEIAPYLYIIFVSILFFYSNHRLSSAIYEKCLNKYGFNKNEVILLFYFFSLNLFVLIYGIIEGTELLALSFFELFLSYFILNKYSGHILGLAILSRYNFMSFSIFLFFNKDYKKIIKNILLLILIILPWFIFNYIHFGNIFSSIVDSYNLNVYSRLSRTEPFNITTILIPINWLIIFFIPGIFYLIVKFFKSKQKKLTDFQYEILFFLILFMFIFEFYNIPFKIVRYLFSITLPIAFFSTVGCLFVMKWFSKYKKIILIFLMISFILTITILFYVAYTKRTNDDKFYNAAMTIERLGLKECRVGSPYWVPVNFYSGNVFYLWKDLNYTIRSNEIALIFPCCSTMDDSFRMEDIGKYPYIYKNDEFILIAKNDLNNKTCVKRSGWSSPMVKDSCGLLSKRFEKYHLDQIFLKICNGVNGKF